MNKKKRIIFIQESLHFGGAERVLIDVLGNFDYAKYDVTLLLMFGEGQLIGQLPDQVRVLTALSTLYHKRNFYRLMRFPRLFTLIVGRMLRRCLRNERFDIAVSFTEGTAARMHYILKNVAERNYSWVHCNFEAFKWYMRPMPSQMLAEFYDHMDGIAAVSDIAGKAFCRVVATSTPVRTIYNICDLERVRRLAVDSCERLGTTYEVCIVGRLIPVKGHRLAIDAIRLIHNQGHDIGLRIVGDGPMMDELKDYVAELGLTDVVSFTGFDPNPYRYMRVADTVLVASESEGLSMIVLEALALGHTVVSTDIDGPRELLGDKCGIICQSTPESMAEALIRSFDNPIDAKVACSRADDFSPSRVLKQIYDFIDPQKCTKDGFDERKG